MTGTRRISSSFTPLLKFIVAPLAIVPFAAAIVLMWWDPQGLVAASPGGTSDNWWSTALLAVGIATMYWSCLSLKRVVLTDDGLEVSNYHRTVLIPFRDIFGVSQITYLHPRIVTVEFKGRTRFGRRIRYLPSARWTFLPVTAGVEDFEVTTIRRRLEPAAPA